MSWGKCIGFAFMVSLFQVIFFALIWNWEVSALDKQFEEIRIWKHNNRDSKVIVVSNYAEEKFKNFISLISKEE